MMNGKNLFQYDEKRNTWIDLQKDVEHLNISTWNYFLLRYTSKNVRWERWGKNEWKIVFSVVKKKFTRNCTSVNYSVKIKINAAFLLTEHILSLHLVYICNNRF